MHLPFPLPPLQMCNGGTKTLTGVWEGLSYLFPPLLCLCSYPSQPSSIHKPMHANLYGQTSSHLSTCTHPQPHVPPCMHKSKCINPHMLCPACTSSSMSTPSAFT